jgi:hypothetical protein
MLPRGFCPDGPLRASTPPLKCGELGQLPLTESSTAGAVVKVRVWAQLTTWSLSFDPHTLKEYGVDAARVPTVSKKGPLAPAGQWRLSVHLTRLVEPVIQNSK